MVALWILLVVGGLGIAMLGSRRAVTHASALAGGKIPAFFVGISLVAVGTDLPEIANSIIASLSGHGDLNVGDSVGSSATQLTLVLGLLPLITGVMALERVRIALVGIVTALSLGLGALLASDGFLSRTDAAVLLFTWLIATIALWRGGRDPTPPKRESEAGAASHVGWVVLALAAVGGGASLAVWGIIEIAKLFVVPEYLISFFATSIGTSLPELLVDVVALRRGETSIAAGNMFGSSFVDATLSLGIGPLIAPTAVTAALAVRGAFVALVLVAAATALLVAVGRHDRRTGIALICAYAAAYPLLVT